MNYTITHIIDKLKAERKVRGLSQRDLSKLAGVPQSHISKIESGAVDLRLSSLIELTRALNLEMVLVPRKVLPAVKSIIRSSVRNSLVHASMDIPPLEIARPAYALEDDNDG